VAVAYLKVPTISAFSYRNKSNRWKRYQYFVFVVWVWQGLLFKSWPIGTLFTDIYGFCQTTQEHFGILTQSWPQLLPSTRSVILWSCHFVILSFIGDRKTILNQKSTILKNVSVDVLHLSASFACSVRWLVMRTDKSTILSSCEVYDVVDKQVDQTVLRPVEFSVILQDGMNGNILPL
jgi:hypothetical protein